MTLSLFLQSVPESSSAIDRLVDVGATGAMLVVAVGGVWYAWKRIDRITDAFIAHLKNEGTRQEQQAEHYLNANLTIANALSQLEKSMTEHDRHAQMRHDAAMKQVLDMHREMLALVRHRE